MWQKACKGIMFDWYFPTRFLPFWRILYRFLNPWCLSIILLSCCHHELQPILHQNSSRSLFNSHIRYGMRKTVKVSSILLHTVVHTFNTEYDKNKCEKWHNIICWNNMLFHFSSIYAVNIDCDKQQLAQRISMSNFNSHILGRTWQY